MKADSARPTDKKGHVFMKAKKTLIFLLFFLGGIILGSLLTTLCSKVSFLSWLTFGDSVGFGYPNPVTLDLIVIKLSFGFEISVNLIKLLSIVLCLWLYKKFAKGV